MVKIVKTQTAFPRGLPGVQINFPLWSDLGFPESSLTGLYRGDFLYMRYRNKDIPDLEKINTNPLLLFVGANLEKGWIEGPNLMLFNKYPVKGEGHYEVSSSLIKPTLDKLRDIHYNFIYENKTRFPLSPLEYKNMLKIFGNRIGRNLIKYWRRYEIKRLQSVSIINIDTANEILMTTKPTFLRSLFSDGDR